MSQVGLQRPVSIPSLASLYPQACRSMCACALILLIFAVARFENIGIREQLAVEYTGMPLI
jgi:hypothetical protein